MCPRFKCRPQLTSILLFLTEKLVDLLTSLSIWDLDIVLGGAILGHEGKETVFRDVELALM